MHTHRMTLPSLFSFLLCLFWLLLAACGASPGASKTVSSVAMPLPVDGTPIASYDQQIYREPLGGDASTFDPAFASDFYSEAVAHMIFAGLVQLDNDLQIQPHLAQSWNLSSDGLQWTFHLQPHLTFSDGTSLTSRDVAYSLDRVLQPATKSTIALDALEAVQDADLLHAGRTKSIIGDSILTPDANTIILKLNKRAAYFLYNLTRACTYVVEKKMVDKYGATFSDHVIEGGGAGPFKLAKYVPKKEIDFVPNPYYNGLKSRLQEVIFITDNRRDTFQDYMNGKIEQTAFYPGCLDQYPKYKGEMHQSATMTITYLAMNFLAKPFDNLHIRQAFALALNRETLLHDLGDITSIGTYHIIPQGVIGYDLNLTGPMGVRDSRGNIALARQLLAQGLREEGLSNMPQIKFSFVQGSDSDFKALSNQWASALGVQVIPESYPFSTLLQKLQDSHGNPNGLQIWELGSSAYDPDPHEWLSSFEPGSDGNDMNYGQNTTADALQEQTVQQQLAQADAETNPTMRLQLYQSAEQQIINQVGLIPLFQWTDTELIAPYVKGMKLNPISEVPPGAWANIYIAAH